MTFVERFKKESMYGVSAKKRGRCRKVAVGGGSTVPLILISLLPPLQKKYSGGYKLLWQPHKQDIIPLSSHVMWQRRLIDARGIYFS